MSVTVYRQGCQSFAYFCGPLNFSKGVDNLFSRRRGWLAQKKIFYRNHMFPIKYTSQSRTNLSIKGNLHGNVQIAQRNKTKKIESDGLNAKSEKERDKRFFCLFLRKVIKYLGTYCPGYSNSLEKWIM